MCAVNCWTLYCPSLWCAGVEALRRGSRTQITGGRQCGGEQNRQFSLALLFFSLLFLFYFWWFCCHWYTNSRTVRSCVPLLLWQCESLPWRLMKVYSCIVPISIWMLTKCWSHNNIANNFLVLVGSPVRHKFDLKIYRNCLESRDLPLLGSLGSVTTWGALRFPGRTWACRQNREFLFHLPKEEPGRRHISA